MEESAFHIGTGGGLLYLMVITIFIVVFIKKKTFK